MGVDIGSIQRLVWRQRSRAVMILSVVVPGMSSTIVNAQGLEFNLVARQFDVVDGQSLDLFRSVAINDLGQVGYTAVATDDNGDQTGSAWLVDGQKVAASGDIIAGGHELGFVGPGSVNASGQVAYSADVFMQGVGLSNTAAVRGDRRNTAGHTLVVGRDDTVAGLTLDGVLDPAISNSGQLAYTGLYFDAGLDLPAAAILHNDQIIAATGDIVGPFVVDVVGGASLNDQGDLAFEATLVDTNTFETSTAIFNNLQLTAISGAVTDGLLLTQVYGPSLNNGGDLAYVGQFFDSDQNIDNTAIIVNGQSVLTGGDSTPDGLVIDLIKDVAINALGQLAFVATFIDPDQGIFFQEGVFVTTRPNAVAGDANNDGRVDAADLNILALTWQQSVTPSSGADFNHDGFIDAGDLNVLALNWQFGVAAESGQPLVFTFVDETANRDLAGTLNVVPTPSIALIMSVGAGLMGIVHRRPRQSQKFR